MVGQTSQLWHAMCFASELALRIVAAVAAARFIMLWPQLRLSRRRLWPQLRLLAAVFVTERIERIGQQRIQKTP